MKKKNITIDTQFFDDGLQAQLKAYNSEDYGFNTLKQSKQSKKQTNQGTSLYSYQRYEYVPDNQYSNNNNQSNKPHHMNIINNNNNNNKLIENKFQSNQKQHQYHHESLQFHQYQQQSLNQSSIQTSYQIKKLQSVALIEKYMMEKMKLFVMKSWIRLKAVLPQYSYLLDCQDYSRENSFKGKSVRSYYQSLMSQKNKNYQYNHNQYNQYNHNNQHTNYAYPNNLIDNSFDSRSLKTNQQIKKQIILRQNNGITLDSLQKRKLSKSKSINHIKIKKNNTQNIIKPMQNQQQNNKNKNNPEKQINKLKGSNVSRKNYRQKFIDYKHRSKSKQFNNSFNNKIKKSYTYQNIQSITINKNIKNIKHNNINNNINNNDINNINSEGIKQQQKHIINNNKKHIQSLGNLNSYNQNYHRSNYNINFHKKNQLLKNIHQLLLNRQSIYQGKNVKYYINHHSRSNQKYYHTHHFNHNHNNNHFNQYQYQQRYNNHINPHKYYQNNNKYFLNYQRQYSRQNQNFDYQRVRLLKQIVDKLNYSKIRYEQQKITNNNNMNNQNDKELMKKIEKIEKIVYELYKDNQNKISNKIVYHKEIINQKNNDINNYHILQQQKNKQQKAYQKMAQELQSIRKLINKVKYQQEKNNKTINQENNNQKVPEIKQNLSDLSNEIILQQQKLLENYRRELQRLTNQRQKQVVIVQKHIATTNNNNNFDSHTLSKPIIRNETQSIGQSYNFSVPQVSNYTSTGFSFNDAQPTHYSIAQPISFKIPQPTKVRHINPSTILTNSHKLTFTQTQPFISSPFKQTPLKQNIMVSSLQHQSNNKDNNNNNTFTIVQKLFHSSQCQNKPQSNLHPFHNHNNKTNLNQIQAYQIKQKIDELNKQTKPQLTDIQRSRKRHQNIKKCEFYGNYPYTRYLVLEEIGLKQQVLLEENKRREIMVKGKEKEKFKEQQKNKSQQEMKKLDDFQSKDQKQQEQIIQRNKSIRQQYQNQWEKYDNQKYGPKKILNICCALFP